MKQPAFVLLVLILLLTGCGMMQSADPGVTQSIDPNISQSAGSDDVSFSENPAYSSNISAEDCYLCGSGMEKLIPSQWGQNNIALVSLNTFEIKAIEINRYEGGQLIEEFAGFGSIAGGGSKDGGFSAGLAVDHNRGYALGSVYFSGDEVPDPGKAANFLCETCLKEILPCRDSRYFGVGAVNLATREARLFAEDVGGFTLGDFYINCDLQNRNDDNRRMDLFIFYCPIRYPKEA